MTAARRWEHFPHGADIGVRGIGPTREAAFEEAARALFAAVADPGCVLPEREVTVECNAPDDRLLFVDWLNALIYRMVVDGMLFVKFKIHIEGTRLQGRAWGEKTDRARHQPAVEPKGATYTELRVAREPDGSWVAQCVVDV